MHIHREALVPYSAQCMYELVHDVAAYPDFLPWCACAQVLSESESEQVAQLTLARGGLRTAFTTRNALTPHRQIVLHLQDGPFAHLSGVWQFEERPHGCRVALDLEFEVRGSLRWIALPMIFAEICNRLVQSFVTEARRRART